MGPPGVGAGCGDFSLCYVFEGPPLRPVLRRCLVKKGERMSNVTRHALRVYAALSEFKGANDDVLDALIPFFEPVLEVMNEKVFNARLFAIGVQRLYKWRFTNDIAESFIPRLLRKGYLKRRGTARDGIYIVQFAAQFGPAANEPPIAEVLRKSSMNLKNFRRK